MLLTRCKMCFPIIIVLVILGFLYIRTKRTQRNQNKRCLPKDTKGTHSTNGNEKELLFYKGRLFQNQSSDEIYKLLSEISEKCDRDQYIDSYYGTLITIDNIIIEINVGGDIKKNALYTNGRIYYQSANTGLSPTPILTLGPDNYDIKINNIYVQERTDYNGCNSTFIKKYLWQ